MLSRRLLDGGPRFSLFRVDVVDEDDTLDEDDDAGGGGTGGCFVFVVVVVVGVVEAKMRRGAVEAAKKDVWEGVVVVVVVVVGGTVLVLGSRAGVRMVAWSNDGRSNRVVALFEPVAWCERLGAGRDKEEAVRRWEDKAVRVEVPNRVLRLVEEKTSRCCFFFFRPKGSVAVF